jgi:hypothetical protein
MGYNKVRSVISISSNEVQAIMAYIAAVICDTSLTPGMVIRALTDKTIRRLFFPSNRSIPSYNQKDPMEQETTTHRSFNKNKLYDSRSGTIQIRFCNEISSILSNPNLIKVLRKLLGSDKIKYVDKLPAMLVHPPGYKSSYYTRMMVNKISNYLLCFICIGEPISIRISRSKVEPDVIRGCMYYYKSTEVEKAKYTTLTLNKGDVLTLDSSIIFKFIKESLGVSICSWLSCMGSDESIDVLNVRTDFTVCKYFMNEKLMNMDEFNYRISHLTEYIPTDTQLEIV